METDEKILEIYSKFSEQMSKEDARIHERVTWGLTINGALITFIGVGFAVLKERLNASIVFIVVYILICIALWLCYNTIQAILDAREQISYLKSFYNKEWKGAVKAFGLPRPFFDRKPKKIGYVTRIGNRIFAPPRGQRERDGIDLPPLERWWGDNVFRALILLWIAMLLMTSFALVTWLYNRQEHPGEMAARVGACTPVAGERGVLRGTEDTLQWCHRIEFGSSTGANYDRFYSRLTAPYEPLGQARRRQDSGPPSGAVT